RPGYGSRPFAGDGTAADPRDAWEHHLHVALPDQHWDAQHTVLLLFGPARASSCLGQVPVRNRARAANCFLHVPGTDELRERQLAVGAHSRIAFHGTRSW